MVREESGLLFPKPPKKEKKPRKPLRYRRKGKRTIKTVSIMQINKTQCYLCGRWNPGGLDALEEHHIFEGNGRRAVSEKYGLKVYLCGCTCHREGPNSVQKNPEVDLRLKQEAQRRFEKECGSRADFIREFGKSCL